MLNKITSVVVICLAAVTNADTKIPNPYATKAYEVNEQVSTKLGKIDEPSSHKYPSQTPYKTEYGYDKAYKDQCTLTKKPYSTKTWDYNLPETDLAKPIYIDPAEYEGVLAAHGPEPYPYRITKTTTITTTKCSTKTRDWNEAKPTKSTQEWQYKHENSYEPYKPSYKEDRKPYKYYGKTVTKTETKTVCKTPTPVVTLSTFKPVICPTLQNCQNPALKSLQVSYNQVGPSGQNCFYNDYQSECKFSAASRYCSLKGVYFGPSQLIVLPNNQALVVGC